MKYPSELELLEFFGVEPVVQGDVTTFTISEPNGLELSVSFNASDDSLQTLVRLRGNVIVLVSQEGMNRLWIYEDMLMAEFQQERFQYHAKVKAYPQFQVEWSGLRTS